MKVLPWMLTLAVASPVLADQKLADSKNCLACHGMKEAVVGPAFKDVAAKYAGRADAPAMLAEKIRAGSVGVWGQTPMPPNDVTAAEARTLADWVLGVK